MRLIIKHKFRHWSVSDFADRISFHPRRDFENHRSHLYPDFCYTLIHLQDIDSFATLQFIATPRFICTFKPNFIPSYIMNDNPSSADQSPSDGTFGRTPTISDPPSASASEKGKTSSIPEPLAASASDTPATSPRAARNERMFSPDEGLVPDLRRGDREPRFRSPKPPKASRRRRETDVYVSDYVWPERRGYPDPRCRSPESYYCLDRDLRHGDREQRFRAPLPTGLRHVTRYDTYPPSNDRVNEWEGRRPYWERRSAAPIREPMTQSHLPRYVDTSLQRPPSLLPRWHTETPVWGLPSPIPRPYVDTPIWRSPSPPPRPYVDTRTWRSPSPPPRPYIDTRTWRSPSPPHRWHADTRIQRSPSPPPRWHADTRKRRSPSSPPRWHADTRERRQLTPGPMTEERNRRQPDPRDRSPRRH